MFSKLSPYHSINRYVNWLFTNSRLQKKIFHSPDFIIDFWIGDSNKPTLLLLPAFAADAKFSWFKQVKELSKKYRLIIPNLLYFGDSESSVEDYSIQHQAKAMIALLEHLNCKEIYLCGASYGAIVACEMAYTKKITVKKMVLTNAPFLQGNDIQAQEILIEFGVKNKSELLVPNNESELKRLFRLTYFNNPYIPSVVFKSIFKYSYAKNQNQKRKLIENFMIELEKLDVKKYRFEFPVLLLWGKYDKLVSQDVALNLKNSIGNNVTLSVIDKTAHMPNYEKPKEYSKVLLDFLNE